MEGQLASEVGQGIAGAAPGNASVCPHGKVRYLEKCQVCWESVLKESKRIVKRCKEESKRKKMETCLPCEHCAEKRRCKVCKGSWICVHDLNKVYCKECDGRRLCQVCWNVTLPRCYEACAKCRREAEAEARLRGESVESVLRANGARLSKRARA
jgi:hypothetical protein